MKYLILLFFLLTIQNQEVFSMLAPPDQAKLNNSENNFDSKKVGKKLREELNETQNELKEIDAFLPDKKIIPEQGIDTSDTKTTDNKIFHYE